MKRFLIFWLCAMLVYTLQAQPAFQTTPPASAGFSAERLARIDQLIQAYIDSNWIEGAIALVARDGKIVYHKAL
jgi:CubicO group peptidase (beta-lactamase class C family)